MRTIAESTLLLRAMIELPDGLGLTTDEFHEGWELARTFDARRLEKQIGMRGWNFIKVADGLRKSGVGDTSQEAIAGALKLALRRISTHFNAAEVEDIELTEYPWFFLARVRVYPYRIQQGAELAVPAESMAASIAPRQRRRARHAGILYPHFASAMPQLKQMLISSRPAQAGPQ
jgi:hypothetical protein